MWPDDGAGDKVTGWMRSVQLILRRTWRRGHHGKLTAGLKETKAAGNKMDFKIKVPPLLQFESPVNVNMWQHPLLFFYCSSFNNIFILNQTRMSQLLLWWEETTWTSHTMMSLNYSLTSTLSHVLTLLLLYRWHSAKTLKHHLRQMKTKHWSGPEGQVITGGGGWMDEG